MDTMEIDDANFMERNLIPQANLQKGYQILRSVTVCLGLLCAVLLAGIIGQFIVYKIIPPAPADPIQANYNALTQDHNLQNGNDNLTAERDRLQSSFDALSADRKQLQAILSNMTEENHELRQSLTSLTGEQDEVKANFSSLKHERDQLQMSYGALKQQRDQLGANYSDMQRSLEGLQADHNNLVATAEQLQTSYGRLQREKDELGARVTALAAKGVQLESNYTSLKRERDQLRASNIMLNGSKNRNETSLNSLRKETGRLQVRYDTLRSEKEQLQTNYRALATAKEQLQKKIDKMTAKIRDMPCPTHWRKFDVSCYFVSTTKKNWTESKQACNDMKADLLIINSEEEQLFVNKLLDKGQNAWIGLTDSYEEGVWKWLDGTPVTTTHWQPGQPNDFDRNQDCGEYVSSDVGTWNDDGCFAKQLWICET